MHIIFLFLLLASVSCTNNNENIKRNDLFGGDEISEILKWIVKSSSDLKCHVMLVTYIMLANDKYDKGTLLTKDNVLDLAKAIPHLSGQLDTKLYLVLKSIKYIDLLNNGINEIGKDIDMPIYMYSKFVTDPICPIFKDLVDRHNNYAIKQPQRSLAKAIYIAAIAHQKLKNPKKFSRRTFRAISSNLFSFWAFIHDLRWRLQLDINGTPFDVMMVLKVDKISIKKKNQLNDLNNAYFESLYSLYIRLKYERALGVLQQSGHPFFGEFDSSANVSDTSFIRLVGFLHKSKSGEIFEYNFGVGLAEPVKAKLIENLENKRTLLQFILLDKTHTNSPFYHSNQYLDADMLYKMIRNELCVDPYLVNGDKVSVVFAQKTYSTPEFLHNFQRDGGLTMVFQVSPKHFINIEDTIKNFQRVAAMPLLTEVYHRKFDPNRISLLGNCRKNEYGEFMCVGNFGKFLGLNIRDRIANYIRPGTSVVQILIQGAGDTTDDNWDALNSASIANRIVTRMRPAYTELYIKRVNILKTVEEEVSVVKDCGKCRIGYINTWWFLSISLPLSIATLVVVLFLLENTKVGVPWYLSKILVKKEEDVLGGYNPTRV